MEKIVSYLEKLGYTVEEQGTLVKYLVVFKDGLPIGFIMPDLSVKLVTGAGEQQDLNQVIAFVTENKDLPEVGGSEYLVASYRSNQLTTFYDVKTMNEAFAIYVHDGQGHKANYIYKNYDAAVYDFVNLSGMMDLTKFQSRKRQTLGQRFRNWLLQYLMNKSDEKAEQR